jgi:1L-myo-inositol 1-phosphate cytidylyltransferase / CDP-L-myo-inositol myo-inositolphosphotransferase
MMEPRLPRLLIVADLPDTLSNLGGISLLERWRRIVRELGFREATILSNSVESVAAHLSKASWHGADVSLKFRERSGPEATVGDIQDCVRTMNVSRGERLLVLFAGFYCDGRLLRALTEAQRDSVLIDSNPGPVIAPLWKESVSCAALLSSEWLSAKDRDRSLKQELASDLSAGRIAAIDAARQEAYVPDMRRSVRPIFFPAPSPENRPLAERLLRETTQKGVLDLPALVHAPIEKWIVSHLCWTSITPNQVTLATACLGISVTLLYAFGHLWVGALVALAVGILDGVDGKLARLKVQTTKIGKGEHALDYGIEMSWWAALAYHFQVTAQVRYGYAIWLVFFIFDVLDRAAKWSVERKLGRSLDDVSRFDRLVRYVSGRRNIYTWLFAFCLLIGQPAIGFVLLCAWGIVSVAIHIFRALQIRLSILPN